MEGSQEENAQTENFLMQLRYTVEVQLQTKRK